MEVAISGEEIPRNDVDILKIWNNDEDNNESLKVLDPDDPLMKRFQDALKAQLMKINERLLKDIDELVSKNNKLLFIII